MKNRNIRNFLILFILLFLTEILFKFISNYRIIDWSTLRIFISTFLIAFLVSFIESFIKKDIINKIITFIVIAFASIYSFLQLGFYDFIGVYMSFQTSSQLGAVTSYVKEFIDSFNNINYLELLPLFLLIIYYIYLFVRKKKITTTDNQIITKKNLIIRFSVFLGAFLLTGTFYLGTINFSFMQNNLQLVSNSKLFKNPSVPSIAVNQFGTFIYSILDSKSIILNTSDELANLSSVVIKQEKEETDYSRIIDDSIWEKINESEKNKIYNNLNTYFMNQDITDKNEYTGLFEDKNLIVIMMESVNDIIINEEYFPNFYKMYSNGWHWENNYSPRNSCATGNNEMSGMLSLYSIQNTCTANVYKENKYSESIFGVFNKSGYKTTSMHNFTEHYYFRNEIHTNMGSGKYYGVEDLEIDYSNTYGVWSSDEDFMTQVVNLLSGYDKEENFMTWLTTVSSHQPYNSSKFGDIYYDLFKDLPYSTKVKKYMSKLKVLDNGLGILLNGLEEKGLLDDTVIVLFGDHYPYGIETDQLNEVLSYDTTVDNNNERVPFVIYNKEVESKAFKEYTSYINILPTLANLFNLEYDPRLYMGSDLLSDTYESITVFADGSWKNEMAFYDASRSKVTYYTDKTYTNEELIEINTKVNNKILYSSLAIKNNYFNYLNEKKKEYQETNNLDEEINTDLN